MPPEEKKPIEGTKTDQTIEVPMGVLADIQKKLSDLETAAANKDAEIEGLKESIANGATAQTDTPLREKKNFEPKFRTVRLRKFPIAGDYENQGIVVGWTNRGAYQEVDRTGVSPQIVDFIDIVFLGHERNAEGKIQAEKVKLLDLLNKSEQIVCKVLSVEVDNKLKETGEEIDVMTFDPQHGLVATGEKVDGFVTFSDRTYTLQVPGQPEPVVVDGMFVN